LIVDLKPEIIFNAAAWTDVDGAETQPDSAFAVNCLGVENLALGAKSIGSILLHISTDYVFSGDSDLPWAEDSTMNPESAYGLSKAEGERALITHYPERSFIVRTAWLYSEHGKNFAKTMCKAAISTDAEVSVVNDQIGQPTSAQDLAVHIIDLARQGENFGIYHGTNSGEASWFDFAREIFRLCGADVDRVRAIPSSQYPQKAKRPSYSVLGHDGWHRSGLSPMQDWKIALERSIPNILNSIRSEGSNNGI
jgi:dTDP-4-dehydrorhamnose reductase